jgi:hypothetical protein
MDQGARFPQVAAKSGHYESFYIKASRPGGGQAIWIRHTVHKRPDEAPRAAIWFVLFDRNAEGPRATKMSVPAAELSVPADSWIRVERAELGPGRARGAVDTEALSASWDLSFAGDASPCKYLPADWLYRAPLPRTKFIAPFPNALFDGQLTIEGEAVQIRRWPGMIGHNWGTEHAERWVWLEGSGFPDSGETYFDAGAARVRIGPWITPWIASGMLMLEGEAHRLGGFRFIRSASIKESAGSCSFVLRGKEILIRGEVSAPKKDFVGWLYADPEGPQHNTINCSAADLELVIERPGSRSRHLSLAAGAAYELGMRETDHGIPIEPYPDG